MIHYLETSAAAKLIFEERESAALATHLDSLASSGDQLISGLLLETELRRAAQRLGRHQRDVTEAIDLIDMIEPDRSIYAEAGLLPGEHLRTLEALHLALALRVGADFVITYDRRQAEAAEAVGLRAASPGS